MSVPIQLDLPLNNLVRKSENTDSTKPQPNKAQKQLQTKTTKT